MSVRVEIQRKREVEREREMASSSSSGLENNALAQKNESERVRDDMVAQIKNRVHGGRAKGKTCHQVIFCF